MKPMKISSIAIGMLIWVLTTTFVLVNVYKAFGKLGHTSIGAK